MTYSIGEVEEITGVKSHILRYWEEAIPGFLPQKDPLGHRSFSQSDIETILRLKYLINEKRFTTEGARKQLIEDAEAKSKNLELMQEIHLTRTELTELYLYVKNLKSKKSVSANNENREKKSESV